MDGTLRRRTAGCGGWRWVVTKSVSPYAIVAGNPPRLIGDRFDAAVMERLIVSRWWTLNDEYLHQLGPHFNDVKKFLEIIERKS